MSDVIRETTMKIERETSFPVRVGGDDGDGVLDTATTVKIIVTTVTHRHADLKLVSKRFFCLHECEPVRNQFDAH